jgi:hypothetical protein
VVKIPHIGQRSTKYRAFSQGKWLDRSIMRGYFCEGRPPDTEPEGGWANAPDWDSKLERKEGFYLPAREKGQVN